MPMSRNPRRYSDIQELLDIAIARGECTVTFNTPGQARSIAHRTNAFMKLMGEIDPETPYVGWRPTISDTTLRILPLTIESAGGKIITEHSPDDLSTPVPARPADPLGDALRLLKDEDIDL